MTDTEREREREKERERQRHRQREKQATCREPDMGLDPRFPGSHLGPQAVLNHCAPRAAPGYGFKSQFHPLLILTEYL